MDSKEVLRFFHDQKPLNLNSKVIGLIGNLGAGKTHLVKEFIGSIYEELKNEVNSPTYTICNIYNAVDQEIHHYDLYRIESEDELYDTGILESIELGNALVFIEWVNMYPELMETCDYIIRIEITGQTERDYFIE